MRNITDSDSRLLPTRGGYIQGYNPQNIVTADGLILATRLTHTPGDVTWYQPMTQAAEHAAALINHIHTHTATTHNLPCTCPTTTSDSDSDSDSTDTTSSNGGTGGSGRVTGPHCRHHNDIGTVLADAGYCPSTTSPPPAPTG